jgi:protein-S-isoprenylcysteine O-methyltransferase Ste14
VGRVTGDRIPTLGRRGEGWVLAQAVAIMAIVVAGIVGPAWPATTVALLVVIGVALAAAGLVLLGAGIVALGSALTPCPRPLERASLREDGVYRLVRHPIYGGLFLLGLGWALMSSPVALVPTAALAVVFELKARVEESMLAERFPDYPAYRSRVRWWFVPGIR